MVGRDARDLRIQAGNTVGCGGRFAHHLLRSLALGHAEKHAQGLTQRFGLGRERQGGATVEVLAVVALIGLPEVLINGIFDGDGVALVLGGHAGLTELSRHLGQHYVGLVVHGVGAQVLTLVDVGWLHPARVSLLAPIEKRRLATHETSGGVVGILLVIGNTLLNDGVHLA